jgi:16S rRNA (guanine527-N7)-methyltransferase
MSSSAESGILDLAREWSIAVATDVSERISHYMRRLLEWNQRVNLTGAQSVRELLAEHIVDSFALSRLVPQGSRVIDVGSGGGLPAVPFSLLRSDCRVTLLEPRAKRIAFLNTVVRECSCRNVRVVRGRVDGYVGPPFDVAMSRATFPPEEWLEVAPSLLMPGGLVVLLTNVDGRPQMGALRLTDSVEYRVSGHATRWAGCYCST